MSGKLDDFFPGTTKAFELQVTQSNTAVDVSSDTITFRMKTSKDVSDASSTIIFVADVATSGASGTALFSIDPTSTNVTPGTYVWDIEWVTSGGNNYVTHDGKVRVKDRVSDA